MTFIRDGSDISSPAVPATAAGNETAPRVLGYIGQIVLYSIAAGVMLRYGMPWYLSLGLLVLIAVGAHLTEKGR